MKQGLALAALAAALITTPATATKIVLTGVASVSGSGSLNSADLPLPWPPSGFAQGVKYTTSVRLSRPAMSFQISYHQNECFVAYDGFGGSGSDCLDNYLIGANGTGARYGTASFTTGADTSNVFTNADGYLQGIEEFFSIDDGYFDNEFSGTDPVGYRIVLYDSVPEPAGWALMIAGFGLAGSALRLRRASFA